MARNWTCGSVWSVTALNTLTSCGATSLPLPSPTGTKTSQSSPLRIPAVSSTLERCVCLCTTTCCLLFFFFFSLLGVSVLAEGVYLLSHLYESGKNQTCVASSTVSWMAGWELHTQAAFHVPEERKSQRFSDTAWMSLWRSKSFFFKPLSMHHHCCIMSFLSRLRWGSNICPSAHLVHDLHVCVSGYQEIVQKECVGVKQIRSRVGSCYTQTKI